MPTGPYQRGARGTQARRQRDYDRRAASRHNEWVANNAPPGPGQRNAAQQERYGSNNMAVDNIGAAVTRSVRGDNARPTSPANGGSVHSQTLPQVTRIPQRNSIGKPASPIRNPRIGK